MTADSLPDDVDPALWFQCDVVPSTRDYLFDAQWHTHPGRMAAYCAVRRLDYRISPSELPEALPDATRYWVQGFLAGNLPRQPDVNSDNDAQLADWQAKEFRVSGQWPAESRRRSVWIGRDPGAPQGPGPDLHPPSPVDVPPAERLLDDVYLEPAIGPLMSSPIGSVVRF